MKNALLWLTNSVGLSDRSKVGLAYQNLLGPDNAQGRMIMADLARYCRVGQTSFVSGDPHQTAFNEGARDVFLHIAECAGLDAKDFPELLEPNQ